MPPLSPLSAGPGLCQEARAPRETPGDPHLPQAVSTLSVTTPPGRSSSRRCVGGALSPSGWALSGLAPPRRVPTFQSGERVPWAARALSAAARRPRDSSGAARGTDGHLLSGGRTDARRSPPGSRSGRSFQLGPRLRDSGRSRAAFSRRLRRAAGPGRAGRPPGPCPGSAPAARSARPGTKRARRPGRSPASAAAPGPAAAPLARGRRAPGSGCRALARASHGAPRPPPRAPRPRLLPPAAAAAAAPPASRSAPIALGSAPGRPPRERRPGSVRGQRGRGALPAPAVPPPGRPRSPGAPRELGRGSRAPRAQPGRGLSCGRARCCGARLRVRREGSQGAMGSAVGRARGVPGGAPGATGRGVRTALWGGGAGCLGSDSEGAVRGSLRARAPPPAPQAAPWAGGWRPAAERAAPHTHLGAVAAASLAVLRAAAVASRREASSGHPSSGRPPAGWTRKGPWPPPRSAGRGRPCPVARRVTRVLVASEPSKSAGGAGSPRWALRPGAFACAVRLLVISLNVRLQKRTRAPLLSPACSPGPTSLLLPTWPRSLKCFVACWRHLTG